MNYMIAGGTGFIGQALVKRWLEQGHKITVIGREQSKIQQIFGLKVTALTWPQLEQQGSSVIQGYHAIINLAGASIGEKRWTAKRKQELIASRVIPTRILAQLCASLGKDSPVLLNASGVGIYGLQAGVAGGLPPAFDETSTPGDPAKVFLAKIGLQWEQALTSACETGVRVVAMRFGVVLAKEGGVLKQLLQPYQLGLGGRLGSGNQPFAWISLADLCSAVEFLISHSSLAGPVNLVAPQGITQWQFAMTLSKILHRSHWLTLPGFILTALLGELGNELLLHGQHVKASKLAAAGFQFQYPDLNLALSAILS